MLRYVLLSSVLLSLAVASGRAADVSGQWEAQIPGRDGSTLDTTFTFKVAGGELTGTMENQYGERDISDGKVAGDDISFSVHLEIGGDEITFLYQGKVAGNEIRFVRERKGGDLGPPRVEFVAKRKQA